MQPLPPDNAEGRFGRTAGSAPPAVITWADDVLYPLAMYRERACRAGARLFRLLLGVDAHDMLAAVYAPGAEASGVKAVLARIGHPGDARIVRKISEAMILNQPKVAPYEDAVETFGLLQALGVPVGLIGEGSRRGGRQLVNSLGADRLFRQIIFADPVQGGCAWQDALMLLEISSGISLEEAVIICADPVRTCQMADMGWTVYFLDRQDGEDRQLPPSVVTMRNLYELPEALGLIAWEPPAGVAL